MTSVDFIHQSNANVFEVSLLTVCIVDQIVITTLLTQV